MDPRRRLVAFAALACAACLPPGVDPLGHPCDDAHLCPTPLVCVDGWCAPATTGGPDAGDGGGNPDGGHAHTNILLDGDFEAGPLGAIEYWLGDGLQIQTGRARSGTYAAELSGSSSVKLSTIPHQAIPSAFLGAPGLYCAQAWVTSQLGAVPKLQLVRTAFNLSQIASPIGPTSTATLDGGAQWQLLQTSIDRPSSDVSLDVTITTALDNNALIFVDDVSVWVSTDGTCPP